MTAVKIFRIRNAFIRPNPDALRGNQIYAVPYKSFYLINDFYTSTDISNI